MRRSAIAWSLDLLGLGYGAYLLAAAGAAVGILFQPSLNFPFAGLGAPVPVLLLWLALRRVLVPDRPDPAPIAWIRRAPAGIWVIGYAVVLTALAIRKHAALESHGSDLGIFVNLFWNLTHGGGWYSGMLERHFFGEHFSPLLILIAPLYRLWPAPECLLAVQSAALALAAWPIYLYARSRLGHGAGLVAMYAYFVYPPVLGIALHDFHEVALAVPLLGFAMWWFSRGRTVFAVLALAGAVLCKEELALTVAGVGGYLLFTRRDWKTGAGLLVAGLAVCFLLVSAVMPAFRGGPLPFADRYSHLVGESGGILAMLWQHPVRLLATCCEADKWRYLLDLLRPLGFLPLLAPFECLPALPTLARNLLSNHEPQFSIYFHYPAPMVPFLFMAVVAGLERARSAIVRFAPGLSTACRRLFRYPSAEASAFLGVKLAAGASWTPLGWLVLAAALWGTNLPARFERFVPSARLEAFHELQALIPADASVSAHNRLVPHVAARRDVCTFPVIRDAEFILLDFGYPDFEYPVHAETHRQQFLHALDNGYRILAARDKFVLLHRQPGTDAVPSPEILDELFFRYRREHLRKFAFSRDVFWQGSLWLFSPGRWQATVVLTPRRPLPEDEPIVFSVHPYLGGRMGEWSLGDLVYDPASAPARNPGADLVLSWEFVQPRWQMLSLRILNDPAERFWLRSVEYRPMDATSMRVHGMPSDVAVPEEKTAR